MTRRRTRKSRQWPLVAALIVVIIAAAIAQHLALILVAVVSVAGGYAIGRHARRGAAQIPAGPSSRGKPQAATKTGQTARKAPLGEFQRRARNNGWLPPATARTITMNLSPECSEGACIICPGCEHGCGHDSRIIDRNMDATEPMTARPGDRPPF